jgi:leader peptidase (prepilin peptidase)/N-methyltransferase
MPPGAPEGGEFPCIASIRKKHFLENSQNRSQSVGRPEKNVDGKCGKMSHLGTARIIPDAMLLISQILLVIASPFLGSFLGAVITRWSTGRPLYSGRATCDCGQVVLSARDMIPIASWAVSGGRCRTCARGLGRLYPAVEVVALAIAVWSILELPGNLIWTGAAFGWALLVIGAIAWREGRLPAVLVSGLGIAGLLLAGRGGWPSVGDHLLGAIAGCAAWIVAAQLLNRWQPRRILRPHDAMLAAALGAWAAWRGLPAVLLIAVIVALILAPSFRTLNYAHVDRALAAGLCAGTWLVWLYGPIFFA